MNDLKELRDIMEYAKIAHGKLMAIKAEKSTSVDVISTDNSTLRLTIPLTEELHMHMLGVLRRQHDDAKTRYDTLIESMVNDQFNDIKDMWRDLY